MGNEEVIVGIRHQMMDFHNLLPILLSSSFLLPTKPTSPLLHYPFTVFLHLCSTASLQDFVYISRFLYSCYMSLQYQPSKCDHSNNIKRRVQNMRLLSMKFSLASSYFLLFSLSPLLHKHIQSAFLPTIVENVGRMNVWGGEITCAVEFKEFVFNGNLLTIISELLHDLTPTNIREHPRTASDVLSGLLVAIMSPLVIWTCGHFITPLPHTSVGEWGRGNEMARWPSK